MSFNPHAVARQIVADTNLADPEEVAAEVFDRTPDEHLGDAYLLLLRTAARDAFRTLNMHASQVPEPRTTPNKSSKVASIRSAHIGYFDQRVFANGDWKMLRDCTRQDVLDLVAQRQAIADKNLSKAAEYSALHDRMVSSGAETVGQLEKEAAA